MAVNYALQDKFLDSYYILNETDFTFEYLISLAKQKDLGLTEFYLANSIDQIEQASQMPVLLKPLDLNKYNEFYKNLSRDLFLKSNRGVSNSCCHVKLNTLLFLL